MKKIIDFLFNSTHKLVFVTWVCVVWVVGAGVILTTMFGPAGLVAQFGLTVAVLLFLTGRAKRLDKSRVSTESAENE